ncbi:hypothetical protein SmJEL517_g00716 [Synchytrium microbalum]|uniref:alcohol dehydrogenase n=1 Tax=Synchytrium microbalum TaxID=1806994 RepID=A0A507C9C9_9FUNG|nr:uncharacterized protein SmJEL517_g00716 [Synchytrium microbalum]TPX37677.1 hypothetical protein SmJEL517_g00716 [Synchytrium microbalum]
MVAATTDVPTTQRAAVNKSFGHTATLETIAVKTPASDEVLVHITHTGVCHTDLHALEGDIPTPLPLVGGHEGVGIVVQLGDKVTNVKLGDRVGVNYIWSSCGTCDYCLEGDFQVCRTLGMGGIHVDGTFQEYQIAKAAYVVPIPDNVSDVDAAPILCAGVTVFRGLKDTNCQPGQFVAIVGAGGGLGHLATQYAKAMGFRVVAIDAGAAKEALTKSLGAEIFIDVAQSKNLVEDVVKATNGGVQGALIVATNQSAFSTAPYYLRPTGTMVCVGAPKDGKLEVILGVAIIRRLTLKGSILGSRNDMKMAMDFVARGLVVPHIEVCGLSEINSVYERMRKGEIAGRVVLDTTK